MTKPLGPRQRKAQLALLGLAECASCRRIQKIELMARDGGRPDTRCRECEALRQKEQRRTRPRAAPAGMTPLSAPLLQAPFGGDAMKKALADAKAVIDGTKRGR